MATTPEQNGYAIGTMVALDTSSRWSQYAVYRYGCVTKVGKSTFEATFEAMGESRPAYTEKFTARGRVYGADRLHGKWLKAFKSAEECRAHREEYLKTKRDRLARQFTRDAVLYLHGMDVRELTEHEANQLKALVASIKARQEDDRAASAGV